MTDIEARFLEPLYSMGKALEVGEVSLLLMQADDQWSFVEQVTKLIGGTLLESSAANAATRFVESMQDESYLFVAIDDVLDPEFHDLLFFYLDCRDILEPRSDTFLQTKHRGTQLHDGHRLVLLSDRSTFESLGGAVPRRLRELCHVVSVS